MEKCEWTVFSLFFIASKTVVKKYGKTCCFPKIVQRTAHTVHTADVKTDILSWYDF